MAALVDTNILVYRFDNRFPEKQEIATEILRRGIVEDSVRVSHQAILEFVAAVTRPIRDHFILKQTDALREAEEFLISLTNVFYRATSGADSPCWWQSQAAETNNANAV